MAIPTEKPVNVFGATLTRRELVKTGGALLVGFGIAGAAVPKKTVKTTSSKNTLDPTLPSSWIEIHPDNTILIRTGKSDFGQGTTFTAYRQIVAEELNAPLRGHHHGGDGRYRSHAGRQRRLRFSRPRNAECSQGSGIYLSGLAGTRLSKARSPEGSGFGQRRRGFRRRKEHVLRRAREGPAVEAHHSRDGRPDQPDGIDGHRRTAHEAGKPIHDYRQALSRTASSHPKSPLASNGPPMYGCPTCCTPGWCTRRRLVQRWFPRVSWIRASFPTRRWS